MALDKQGILNELGSVMNKLQSADCGCMGKLFSNPNGGEGGAMGNPQSSGGCGFGGFGGCRGGCCHGRGGFNFGNGGGEPCMGMGNCNPRKIYADTYNYLNTNLMQPTVNEVYNDLKSITPENTVMNNSMAAKMGLSPQGNMQGGKGMQGGNPMQGGNGMQGGNPMQGGNGMQGGNPMQGGNGMQGGNFMQGGNPMEGGNGIYGGNAMYGGNANQGGYPIEGRNAQEVNYMQGGNAMYGGNAMQGGYSIEGENNQRGTPIRHSQMMSNPMGNQMQGSFGNDMTNQRVQQMMGGMGPNIVDMMKSGGNAKPMGSTPQSGQMPGQMLIDAPQSPHGKVGVTPMNAGGPMYSAEGGMLNNPNQLFTPTTQYVTGADMTSSGFNPNEQNYNAMNMQQGQTNPNMQQGMGNPNMQQGMTNPSMQQGMANRNMQHEMANPNTQHGMIDPNMQQGMANPNMHQSMARADSGQTGRFNPAGQQNMAPASGNYGQHSQGMKKFNEMFPGVIGGDLGFDPMAIAVQMNPENHKKAAMDQMNKMMSGNKGHMGNASAGANAAAASFGRENAGTNQQNAPSPPSNQQALYGQPGTNATPIAQNQQYGGDLNAAAAPGHLNQQQVYYKTNRAPQQPVYTGAPATNQEQAPPQQQYQYQQQQMIDPNTGAPQTSPAVNQGAAGDVNAQQQGQGYSEPGNEAQLLIQDPIFPADTSKPFHPPLNMRRQKYYQYNTLGQPVQMIPAKMFHSSPETNLPQTLYPQPPSGKLRNDMSGHNVKSTVSKTSLMGNKPVGRTPSRSQLQNIYHQYKGSHSNTQQNVRNPAGQSDSYSEGKLGVQRVTMNQARPAPVERVGGDTAANNQAMHNLAPVKELPVEQHGDVPAANKPHNNRISSKEPPKMQGNVGNVRNGLQDMVYTAYPTSAAWSFHGDGGMPYVGYRGYRGRA